MFPILGIRIGFYYDLFTEACICVLPSEENQPSPDYESLFFSCFFVFRGFVEKSWR